MAVWKMIFLLNLVIFRFQTFIFEQDFNNFQVETVQARINAVVQVLSTLAGGNGNLTTKVEENAMQMAKQGTLTALKLAKISAGEFVDAMRTMPEQDDIPGGC